MRLTIKIDGEYGQDATAIISCCGKVIATLNGATISETLDEARFFMEELNADEFEAKVDYSTDFYSESHE